MNLYFIDFISPPITLYYRSYLKHSSIPSVIISVISIIALTVFSIIFSLDFICHRNPFAYYYHEYVEDAGIYPFNSSQMFHFITIGEAVNEFEFDPKAISLIGVAVADNIILANNNESEYDHWIYDFCEGEIDAKDKMNYLSSYKERFINKGLCIKKFYNSTTKKTINFDNPEFQYPVLAHGNSNPNEILYGVFMQRCQNNSIINNFTCYDSLKIDSLIKLAVEYSIYFVEQNIFINNYKNPFSHFFYRLTNHFNTESYTINHLNFHPSVMKTHSGIIFDHISYKYTYSYDANEKFVVSRNEENNNTNIYAMYYFWMQNLEDIYERKYKMLQDICGSIGGIIKIITLAAELFNYFFHEFTIIYDLNSDILFKYKKLTSKYESNHNMKRFSSNVRNSITQNLNNFKLNQNKKYSINNYMKNENSQNKSNNSKSPNTLSNFIEPKKILDKLNSNEYILKRKSNVNYNFIFHINKDLYNDNHSPYNGFTKIFCLDVFFYKIGKRFKNKLSIENLIKFREVIISEEALFSSFYLQKSFEKLIMYFPQEDNVNINKMLQTINDNKLN